VREQRVFRELVAAIDQGPFFDEVLPTVAAFQPLHTVQFDISADVHELLHATHRLIYSPHTIASAQLQPFLHGQKEVRLVFAQNGKSLPATLQILHSSYLIVDTKQSVFRRKPGETVLVVFPITPQQSYVLQTTIHNVYAFRLELEYRDPRYGVRHVITATAPVTVQPVPALFTALTQQQGRVMRHVSLTPRTTQGTAESLIADLFCAPETRASRDSVLTEPSVLVGTLRDISLGGVCLVLDMPQTTDLLATKLIQLRIPLPRASQALPEWKAVALTLQVLGMVCGVSQTSMAKALHIRFMKRLFPEVGTLFWHLEGNTPPSA